MSNLFQISNIIFFVLLALSWAFLDRNNIFDFVIAITSLWEQIISCAFVPASDHREVSFTLQAAAVWHFDF